MTAKAGKDFKLYYDTDALTSADGSTGTFSLITIAQNVTRNVSRDQFEANTRASEFKQYLAGLKDLTIETTLVYDADDDSYDDIKTAYDNDNEIAIADMDGLIATPGSKGIAGNFRVTQFQVEEPLDGPGTVSVTFSHSSYGHFYEVST